jgi:hypothetical protein
MNIFYLSETQQTCAEQHNDKHVVKMIIEYAQLLSTAHRVLDGYEFYDTTANGRKIKRWKLEDERDDVLYKATHINHPSAVWVRQSDKNYDWLYGLYQTLMTEYTYRYGKVHACSKLEMWLARIPNNIPQRAFTEPTPAMPDKYKVTGDSITSYKNYYIGDKQHIASWKKRTVPNWYVIN